MSGQDPDAGLVEILAAIVDRDNAVMLPLFEAAEAELRQLAAELEGDHGWCD